VEAIHTTLRKHLAKEEAQLLPLLLAHFSHPEQAELVAQFLYCIPLDTVERVVTWLRPAVPARELQQLLGHLGDVVPDNLLLQLLAAWLSPPGAAAAVAAGAAAGATGGVGAIATAAAAAAAADGVGEAAGGAAGELAAAAQEAWPPLQVRLLSGLRGWMHHGCVWAVVGSPSPILGAA
jgi:zinc finger-like protein